MAENDAARFHSIVAELKDRVIVLLPTATKGSWSPGVRKATIECFKSFGLTVVDRTGIKVSSPDFRLGDREHLVILHGAEDKKPIRVSEHLVGLSPDRLAVVVRNRRVASLEGLSAKDHLRVKIEKNDDKVSEVCRRILVVFGAPPMKAADSDSVKWAEAPQMVTVKKEKDSALGLSIVSRMVHPSCMFRSITLIRNIEGPGCTATDRLRKFMHIQSINGLPLDGLSAEDASEVIRSIEEGPVFLMVRQASRDPSRIKSPPTPYNSTHIFTGVCRLHIRPFELKWREKGVSVQMKTDTLQLLPALITEPRSVQQKATIIAYADNDYHKPNAKGHLIVAVDGKDVLTRPHSEVKKMILDSPRGMPVSLTLYLCEEGPKPLAEQIYSEIIQSFRPAQNREGVQPPLLEDQDEGVWMSSDPNLEPVVLPSFRAIPIYFTGSNRYHSTQLYNQVIESVTTAEDRLSEDQYYPKESSGESLSPLGGTPSLEQRSLAVPPETASLTLNKPVRPQALPPSVFSSTASTSSNSPSPLSIRRLPSGSRTSVRSADSACSHKSLTADEPHLLTIRCVDHDWKHLSMSHPCSQGTHRWYALQNVDDELLKKKQYTLCPLQELLFLKPNTICVYAVNLEELTLNPHSVYIYLYEFLCFFQLRHKPIGMQVLLVGMYDSSTAYGQSLTPAKLEWLHTQIDKVLQGKGINELLLEEHPIEHQSKGRILMVPFDLNCPENHVRSLQEYITECVKKYDLRAEPRDNHASPQNLKQWSLFWKKVMDLSSYCQLVSREELLKLASKVLWIEEGPLFDQCLKCLDQTTLLQVHTPDASMDFLTRPDVIVKLIATLADRSMVTCIRDRRKKMEADKLGFYAHVTESWLQRTLEEQLLVSPSDSSCIVQWIKHLGIALPIPVKSPSEPYVFIPALTTSQHWKVRPEDFIINEELEFFVELPESTNLLFFHNLIVRLLSEIDFTDPTVEKYVMLNRACTKVRFPKLTLNPFYAPFDVLMQYSVIQSHVRIAISPWHADLVSTAENFFRKLILDTDPSLRDHHITLGPQYSGQDALACTRSNNTFDFLDSVLDAEHAELSKNPPEKPVYVVNVSNLRAERSNRLEPFLSIRSPKGNLRVAVKDVKALHPWVYQGRDPNRDADLVRALSKVQEWLLLDPQVCVLIACEEGILERNDPECFSWPSLNGGEKAPNKLIMKWQAANYSISRLHDALSRHNQMKAAEVLKRFCHESPH